MRDDERECHSITGATAAVPIRLSAARCQVCGAPHAPTDSIFCEACGEPVLLCGWA
jgi:hypothetical protein